HPCPDVLPPLPTPHPLYAPSLHDALPLSRRLTASAEQMQPANPLGPVLRRLQHLLQIALQHAVRRRLTDAQLGETQDARQIVAEDRKSTRLLQSRVDLVCRLLLEKKKNI